MSNLTRNFAIPKPPPGWEDQHPGEGLIELFHEALDNVDTAMAGIGGGAIQKATVTLTSAQLKNLIAVPPQLVAAPGAGKYTNIVSAVLDYKAGITAYTLNGQSQFGIGHAAALGNDGFDWFQSIAPFNPVGLNTTNSAVMQFGPAAEAAGYPLLRSEAENQPIILALGNPGGSDLTDGNGTLAVTVYYTIVDLS